ncbi:unnamed protein product [Arabidopsis thaliana]|uniref:Uncharacterized protein n=2 Tax=Arabidopsis thaliana TaxID=3702 RepID=A0A654EK96_ARATH|nr:uncharacterized protein AT1G55755 [Arabidopsis thaliana]ANM59720.1 hypothetical protein AT1G55755 [Arabidopsis thaliana]CAA0297552.1 unnamed protein product [Arabidopsis thaliana]VYS49228.1 unnamed protein product [Arabidopsis thaliana]|eukprot:NP_001322058.1 hypothetical protein AT1G55755 [Arabidopsis thaliana]
MKRISDSKMKKAMVVVIGTEDFVEDFRNQISVCALHEYVELVSDLKYFAKLHKISHAASLQFRSCKNMLRKTGERAARTAR